MRSFRLTLYVFHLTRCLCFQHLQQETVGFLQALRSPCPGVAGSPAWGPLVTLAQAHSYRLMAAGRCPALLQSLRGCRLTAWVLLTCIHTSGRDWHNDPRESTQDCALESFWRLTWEYGCIKHRASDGLCRTMLGYLNLLNGSMPLVTCRHVKD